jgi:PAS domain-containing protein
MKTSRDRTKAQLLEELEALHKEVSTLRDAVAVHRHAARALEETATGPLAPARDVTERRDIEDGLEKARKELAATKISEDETREYSESIINTVREPLIALDQDLRVVSASRSGA